MRSGIVCKSEGFDRMTPKPSKSTDKTVSIVLLISGTAAVAEALFSISDSLKQLPVEFHDVVPTLKYHTQLATTANTNFFDADETTDVQGMLKARVQSSSE
jgi:hypothetical protein